VIGFPRRAGSAPGVGMWTRGIWRALLSFVVLVLLSSCGTSSTQRTPVSSAAPTVPTRSATTTPVVPKLTVTPSGLVLQPPQVTLSAQAGEQAGNIGSYFWVHESGLAAEGHASGFPAQQPALTLHTGETAHFRFSGGPAPTRLTVAAYTKDENTSTIGANNTPGFVIKTSPVTTTTLQLSGDTASWPVSLAPGQYYLVLHAEWPAPAKNPVPGRQPSADYAFTITVQ